MAGKLVEAAATSAVFVVVLSRSFGRRFWCLRELDLALHGHPEYPRGDAKPCIIPVFIDPPSSINKFSKEEVEQQLQEHMAALARGQDPVSEGQALQELLQDPERLINNLSVVGDYQAERRRRQSQQQQQQQGPLGLEQELQETLHLERQPLSLQQQQQQQQALTSNTAASSSKPVPVPKDGGMGKTTMAKLLYNTLRSSFTHAAMVELELEGSTPEQLRNHLKTVCESLELPAGGAGPELQQRLADSMQHNKVLLLLDNVNHSTQLDGLLPTTWSCGSRVIITSREAVLQSSTAYEVLVEKRPAGQPGPPIRSYGLSPLQDEASKELFRARHGLSETELETMGLCDIERQLLKACSGLPLALRVVGGALKPYGVDEQSHVKRLWQEVGQFAYGRWKSTGSSDETKLLQDVVYYSFSRLSEAAQNMFLDCVSVLHQVSYHKAMIVWEAWWPHEAHRAFDRLKQLSLVNTAPSWMAPFSGRHKADDQCLVVLDVIRSLGQSIILTQSRMAADLGRYYGSRIWLGQDGQPAGIVVGAKPVGVNLRVWDPQQYPLQGCDWSELRILMTTDVAPDVWYQAPHLLCVCYLWSGRAEGRHTELPPVPQESCRWHTAPANMQDSKSSPLQKLVLMELLQSSETRPTAGWQELLHILCKAEALPALRRVELNAQLFEQCGDENELRVFAGTISRCSRLQHLNLSLAAAQSWALVFNGLPAVECIQLGGCKLTAFPESFGGLSALQELHLTYCGDIANQHFGALPCLRSVFIRGSYLPCLSESFLNLSSLQLLQVDTFRLCALPDQFGRLTALQALRLGGYQGSSLPDSFWSLTKLKVLRLPLSGLSSLPEAFGDLTALQVLDLLGEQLEGLPESFGGLRSLQVLSLSSQALYSLPESFVNLSALRVLDLRGCRNLTTLPEAFGQLTALQVLDMSACVGIQGLPSSFGALVALEELYMPGCEGLSLSGAEVLLQLPALKWLDLSGCWGLDNLPRSLSKLTTLQEFAGPHDSARNRTGALKPSVGCTVGSLQDKFEELYVTDLEDILKQCNDGLLA